MRKTRVLAALLCLMMIATAIPMMQASANTTYTETEILTGVEEYKAIAFADYAEAGIAFAKLKRTGATISNWDNNGVFTSHAEYLEETETYELTAKTIGERTQAVVAAEDGLTFSFGNRKRYGSDIVPYNDGGYYTPRTIVSWPNDVVGSPVNDGAVKITVKLLNQYSQGAIEFIPDASSTVETDDSKMDIIFNVNGFTVRGAGTAAYTMDVDTYYDIVIKKEVDSYAIYAKKESDSAYTKVTTYTADYTASSVVGVSATLPCGNTANTDVMVTTTTTMDGDKEVKKNTYSWVKPDAGVIDTDNSDNVVTSVLKDNVTAYLTMSQVSYKSIASYSKVDAALNAILGGALKNKSIAFADYFKGINDLTDLAAVPGVFLDGVAKDYASNNDGPHIAAELTTTKDGGFVASVNEWNEAQSKWVSTNGGNRTQVWQLTKEDHLRLSAGNYWLYGNTAVSPSPYYDYGKIKVTGYIGTDATKVEVALKNDVSSGTIDFNKNITTDDIVFDKTGFTIGGTANLFIVGKGFIPSEAECINAFPTLRSTYVLGNVVGCSVYDAPQTS